MKKIPLLLATLFAGMSLASCASDTDNHKKDNNVLRVYNWQDYIFEGDKNNDSTIQQFKDYYKQKYKKDVQVEYYTFETNETMLNVLKTGKSNYDLICPSDYTIQKMIKDGMVEKIDINQIPNYTKYASHYIQDLFNNSKTTNENDEVVSWSEYSVAYMWGTMGFMYDPSYIKNDADIRTWEIVWNKEYKYLSTLKDSVRDTYCAAVFYVYKNELQQLKIKHQNNEISDSEYNNAITEIMNRKDEKTIKLVEKALQEAKENIYGFEVDSGKSDIVTGKIAINFCWSGDAVYSMDCAEEESDVYLNYVVPEEGSNVWFDGWVMPKGANKELAYEFINFLCDPKIAALNMGEVGYTSSIAGQEMWELVNDWYGCEESATASTHDVSYFFENTGIVDENGNPITDFIIYTEDVDRQLSAQYPTYDTIIKCAIMQDFGKQNSAILEMWIRAKSDTVPIWAWIFIGLAILFAGGYITINKVNKYARNKRIEQKKQLSK